MMDRARMNKKNPYTFIQIEKKSHCLWFMILFIDAA